MTSFTQDQIESALNAKSDHLGQQDIRRIAEAKEVVAKMIDEFPDQWKQARERARLLFQMIQAAAVGKFQAHPEELKFAAGALIYLGDPLDIVPDDQEDGYEDDAAIVELAIAKSKAQVEAFCAQNNLDAATYLS